MKSITLKKGQMLHVETPNGIINIRTGLTDRLQRPVDSIQVVPANYMGENKVKLIGPNNTRLVRLKTKNIAY